MLSKPANRAKELVVALDALDPTDDFLPSAEDMRGFAILFRATRRCWKECEAEWGSPLKSNVVWAKEVAPEMELAFRIGRAYQQLVLEGVL